MITNSAAPNNPQLMLTHSLPFALICIGAFFRLYNFWKPPIWIDEYGTWWIVAGENWREVIQRALAIQGQSPFYYLIVKVFTNAAGYGAFQLRLPSLVFGIATLTVVYPLALRIFCDRQIAIISLVIFSIGEPMIWYSQIARPYALALLFTLLSFWSLLSLLSKERTTVRVAYILSTTLVVYAHYLFGFIIVIQFVYMISVFGYRRLLEKAWLSTFFVMAFLFLPMHDQVIDLLSRRRTLDWVSGLDWSHKIAAGVTYIFGSLSPLALAATLIAVMILGFNWSQLSIADVRLKLRLPLIWYAVPPVFLLTVPILSGINLFEPRYLLFSYPAMYFLLAWFMLNVQAVGVRKWIPVVVFTTIASSTALSGLRHNSTFSRWPDPAWSDAASGLTGSYKSDDIIVAQVGLVEADQLATGNSKPHLESYLRWPVVANLSLQPPHNIAILPYQRTDRTQGYLNSIQEKATRHRRVWLLGGGDVVEFFLGALVRDSDHRLVYQSNHGKIQLYLLEKTRQAENSQP